MLNPQNPTAMRASFACRTSLLSTIEADRTRHVVEQNNIKSSEDVARSGASTRRHARTWSSARSKHQCHALRTCTSRQLSLDLSGDSRHVDYECSQYKILTGLPTQTQTQTLLHVGRDPRLGSAVEISSTFTTEPAASSALPALLDFMQFFGMDHHQSTENSQHLIPFCGSGPALLEARTASNYQDETEHDPRLRKILELLLDNKEAAD